MRFLPPCPKKYKGWLALGIVGLVLFAAIGVYGEHGLLHLLRMRSERQSLAQMAFGMQQRNEELRTRLVMLQSDDRYLERLARERLGFVKEDELVYRVRGSHGARR
jgi:cell division protein FtsB